MKSLPRKLCLAVAGLGAAATLGMAPALPGQAPARPAQSRPPAQEKPLTPQAPQVIRRSVDLVTTDVIVRNAQGQFDANLKQNDFDVYEDGVQQKVVSFVLTHGGRVYNVSAAPPKPTQEGILLPPPQPTNDAAGRIFIIFVDDLHLDFRNTGRIRQLFQKISKDLIHDGDMFAIQSTGPSSLAIDLTYDRRRLDEAIKKISGAGLKPADIIETPETSQGPPEVRYRAHVAFSTANDTLKHLEQVHNRRKAFIYVSDGYDFNPFPASRGQYQQQMGAGGTGNPNNNGDPNYSDVPDVDPFSNQSNEFAEADLVQELAELTREANRANATIYTIDPRGLVGGPDLDENIDQNDWNDYIRETQNSLRVLADLTGGIAVVNQNDFDKALKKIDAETSDYYVLGYYSSNPDPTKKRRTIQIKVTAPGNYDLKYRTSYTLKPLPAGAR